MFPRSCRTPFQQGFLAPRHVEKIEAAAVLAAKVEAAAYIFPHDVCIQIASEVFLVLSGPVFVHILTHASELSKNHVTGTQSVSASTGTSAAFIALRPSSYF